MYTSACFNLDTRKHKEKESSLYSVMLQESSRINVEERKSASV